MAILALLAAAAGVVIWLFLTSPEPTRSVRPRAALAVETLEVRRSPITMTIRAYGAVQARTDLQITAQVSGEIVQMSPLAYAGDHFPADELLFTIDPRKYQLAVEDLESQIAQSETELERLRLQKDNLESNHSLVTAELELAQRDLNRRERLLQTSVDTQAEFDRVKAVWLAVRTREQAILNSLNLWPQEYAAARNRLDQLKTRLGNARLDLEHCHIRAPFAGRVVQRNVEQGQFVNIGAAVVRIYDAGSMEVSLRMPLEDLQWVDVQGVGSGADRDFSTSAPTAVIRNNIGVGGFAWNGVVSRMAPDLDSRSRSAGLFVQVLDPIEQDNDLMRPPMVPGLYVEVELQGRLIQGGFAIPRGAVHGENTLYLAVDGMLQRRNVAVLRKTSEHAYVGDGLDDGEAIILSPVSMPIDGMALQVLSGG